MLLTPLLLVAALHTPAPAVPLAQQTSANTAEGLEILRRILVDSLEKSFQTEKEHRITSSNDQTEGIVQFLMTGHQTVQNSRVFHLPDSGVFFALDVSLPMIEKKTETKDQPAGDAPRDDEWEKYRREVRGGGSTSLPGGTYVFGSRTERSEMEIDPAAVEKLIDTALQALARHTSRVEGLSGQETLTLAMKVSGGAWGTGGFWGTSLFDEGAIEIERSEPDKELPRGAAGIPRVSTLFALSSSASQNLVLQIRASDLQASANPGELRRRARINRY